MGFGDVIYQYKNDNKTRSCFEAYISCDEAQVSCFEAQIAPVLLHKLICRWHEPHLRRT